MEKKHQRIGEEKEYYVTPQIMEATFLAYKGFKPQTFYDREQRKTMFSFLDNNMLIERLLEDFWKQSEEYKLLETARVIKRLAIGDNYQKGFYVKRGE